MPRQLGRLHLAPRLFIAYVSMFIMVRIVTFPMMHDVLSVNHSTNAQFFLVGAMSDIWIATLWMFIFLSVSIFFKNTTGLFTVMTIFMAILCSLETAYVKFFSHPIHPFHLSYLIDIDFIKSNMGSSFDWEPLAVLLVSMLILIFFKNRRPTFSARTYAWIFASIVVTGILTHAANIRYRVNWFVPDALQVNGFEHMYLKWKLLRVPDAIDQETWEDVISRLPKSSPINAPGNSEKDQIQWYLKVNQSEISSTLKTMKRRLDDTQKPIVIMYLAESQRPADRDTKSHLMPALQELMKSGTSFTRAFSTGNVTRSSQEAVLCGYPSGFSTSTMRGQSQIDLTCVSRDPNADSSRKFLWLHGGDGGFDNQETYWRRQGFHEVLTRKDFPMETPSTGWGVSDLAFVDAAAKRILVNAETGPVFSFLLSATNHIPWALPSDAKNMMPSKPIPDIERHHSYKTTLYADQALGELVKQLKNAGVWERTLFIYASDHGHLVQPFNEAYNPATRKSYLRNHVHLVFAGGITEQMRRQNQVQPTYEHTVTLDDVGFALAHLLHGEAKQNFMGADPFVAQRIIPSFVDTGEDIYIPELDRTFSRKFLLEQNFSGLSDPEYVAAVRYVSFLRWGFHASFSR